MGDVRHEPSMEEILSSIKRIIAEDSDAVLSAARQRRPMRPPEPETFDDDEPEDVLELTAPEAPEPPVRQPAIEPVRAQAPSRPEPAAASRTEPAAASRPEPAAAAPDSAAPVAAAAPVPPVTSESLLSSGVADATRQALASLSTLIVKPAANADNTLDGLVREMLRPMLKEWLDAHLPTLVEGLVAREIARLTGQGL